MGFKTPFRDPAPLAIFHTGDETMQPSDRQQIETNLRRIARKRNLVFYRYGATGQPMKRRQADQSHSLDGFHEESEVLFETSDKETITAAKRSIHDWIHDPRNRRTAIYLKYDPTRRDKPFRMYSRKRPSDRYYLYVNWVTTEYRPEDNTKIWAGNRALVAEIIEKTKNKRGKTTVHESDASYRAAFDGSEMFAFSIAQQSGHLHLTTCPDAWRPGIKQNNQTTKGRAKITGPRLGKLIAEVRRLLADTARKFPPKVHIEDRWTLCDCVKRRFPSLTGAPARDEECGSSSFRQSAPGFPTLTEQSDRGVFVTLLICLETRRTLNQRVAGSSPGGLR